MRVSYLFDLYWMSRIQSSSLETDSQSTLLLGIRAKLAIKDGSDSCTYQADQLQQTFVCFNAPQKDARHP